MGEAQQERPVIRYLLSHTQEPLSSREPVKGRSWEGCEQTGAVMGRRGRLLQVAGEGCWVETCEGGGRG